jgi:hypothetical protein
MLWPLAAGAEITGQLEILADPEQVVVGEMIPVTLRGTYKGHITNEDLTLAPSPHYEWIQTARDTWTDTRIDGALVKVFERQIAVFARRDGPLTIGPFTHHLKTPGASGLDDVAMTAAPITLPIAPFPADAPPLAARHLTLTDALSADPGRLEDGEILIRRVTLDAKDALAHQLPLQPPLRTPWLITFTGPETRETEARPDGPEASVTWEWHLKAKTGAPGVLPEVPIQWFNTQTRQMETLTLPAIPFGYASFAENAATAPQLPQATQRSALALFAASLLAALLWMALSLQWIERKALRQWVLRRLPDPSRKAVRRAARAGDLTALGQALDAHKRRCQRAGVPLPDSAMDRLNRALFGRETNVFDAGQFIEEFDRSRRRFRRSLWR